jgi:hypothetical protein
VRKEKPASQRQKREVEVEVEVVVEKIVIAT